MVFPWSRAIGSLTFLQLWDSSLTTLAKLHIILLLYVACPRAGASSAFLLTSSPLCVPPPICFSQRPAASVSSFAPSALLDVQPLVCVCLLESQIFSRHRMGT